MLSVDEATQRILAPLHPLSSETVSLEHALGRVLAQDVVARRSQPPTDVSAMDGYAVRADDLTKSPADLNLIGEVAAGSQFAGTVGAGQAARIFTGGNVPPGADTVVIQEDTEALDGRVRVLEVPRAGQHIRRRGIDFSEGDAPLKAGRRLTARDLGLIAGMNVTTLTVTRKPVIAILATGDELVLPGDAAADHQIVSSSPNALGAYIEQWGGVAKFLGIARDSEASLQKMASLADGADFLITIGGASVGDHDLIQKVLGQDGLTVDFWKIAMKPGKPLISGRLRNIPMLGLPGNPVSSLVCALLFLKPAVGTLLGMDPSALSPRLLQARLAQPLKANAKRQDYLRARLQSAKDGALEVSPFDLQDSSVMSIFAAADGLIIRPPHAPAADTGDLVQVLVLDA